jgi:hemolysin activation/secretion protein
MSLMKLSPETVRLRRVAKAHALGEFSLIEYRRARREVIENFDPGQVSDDDTQPRSQILPEPPAPPAPEKPRRMRWWMAALLAAVALLGAAQLMAGTDSSLAGVFIPPVADRDPNPATSPRLPVTGVRLDRVDDRLTLDADELQAVADARLEEIRARNQPGQHGFTPGELAEVGRLLNAMGAHAPDVSLSGEDARDLSALLREQKKRRGISIVELEEVASAVQQRAREAGYFLAVAYLPSQEVRDGRVTIALLPGVIGEVLVDGASERLAARFGDLIDRPITRREINTRLYTLNQAPGFTAQTSFEPGGEPGETRLRLEVLERTGLKAGVAVDNYGDEHTGKQRLVLAGDLINPSGRGDVLSLGLTAALDPSNQVLGLGEYVLPIGARRQVRGRIAKNDFSSGEIDGQGWLFDAVMKTHLYRDRRSGLSYEVGLGRHVLDWQTPTGDIEQRANVLSLALDGRRVWDEVRIATDFRVYAGIGSVAGDRFLGQDDGFWDLGFDLFAWHPFDLPGLPGRQKVSVLLKGQFSGTQLPSTRRLALGGVAGARGFERDTFLADQGAVLRLDLRTPLGVGELALFGDLAYGQDQNDLTPGWAHLADLGVSWDVRIGAHLMSSLSWAVPVTAKGNGGLEDDGARLFWSIRYAQ